MNAEKLGKLNGLLVLLMPNNRPMLEDCPVELQEALSDLYEAYDLTEGQLLQENIRMLCMAQQGLE